MPMNLKPLTAMRFWAALWVVLYDFWPDLTGARPPVIGSGHLGVELFFVLSGFILSHVYLRAWEGGGFHYGSFLWARLSRIWPLHIATTLGIGVLGGVAILIGAQMTHDVLAWDALPANIFMVHAWNLAPRIGWNHASWSISAEWFAYVAFPLFAMTAARLSHRPRLTVAAALAFIFIAYASFERFFGFPLTLATNRYGWLRIVPPFAYGCALQLMWRSGAVASRREAKIGFFAALGGVLALTFVNAPDAAVVGVFGLLILSLAGLASTGSAWFTDRVSVYLGESSFALYMVVVPWRLGFGGLAQRLLHVPDGGPWPLPIWLALVGGAVVVGMLAHNLVERPARLVMRRMADLYPMRPREEPRPC